MNHAFTHARNTPIESTFLAVIDTVKLRTRRKFRPDLIAAITSPEMGVVVLPPDLSPGWSALVSSRSDPRKDLEPRLILTHESTGLRLEGPASGEVIIGASFPVLLYGHNGCLLRNQQQIHDAITIFWNLADQVLAPGARTGEFIRVDLTWHLPVSPQRLLKILKHIRHPQVRREKLEYNTSLTFGGNELRLVFYDKQRKMNGRTDRRQTRVEIQILTGRKLCQLLDQQAVTSLNFGKAYSIYRSLLCQFDTRLVATSLEFTTDNLIAWALHNNWSAPGGESILDWWATDKEHETVVKRRRIVEGISYSHHDFRFADLLPENHPPEDAADVLPRPRHKPLESPNRITGQFSTGHRNETTIKET